jgi:hypothetical protein
MQTVADSFAYFLESAPLGARLRSFAAELPHRLGLVQERTQGWDAFIKLAPDRDLPAFAARTAMPDAAVDKFLRAHHLGGFYGVTCDRIDDGQVSAAPELETIRSLLLASWVDALADATGDSMSAADAVRAAVGRAVAGTKREKEVRRGGDFPRYASAVRDKLDWIVLAARAQLESFGDANGARLFTNAYHRVLLALQCRDDVVDAEEDRLLHGTSMTEALGLSDATLLRTSVHLLRDAARLAKAGGFDALFAWAAERASATDYHTTEDFRRDDVQALLLSWCAGGEDA